MKDIPVVIGMRIQDAFKLLSKANITFRVIREDNKITRVDRSMNSERLNLYVEEGIVVNVANF